MQCFEKKQVSVLEIDELFTFVEKKKCQVAFGQPLIEIPEHLRGFTLETAVLQVRKGF